MLEKILEDTEQLINMHYEDDSVKFLILKNLRNVRKHINDGWIPVNERLPENDRSVLMCGDTGCIDVGWWNGKRWKTGFSHADNFEAVAWRPLPEPYRPERSRE